MTTTGLDFVALQVSDPERSAAFYESHLGLTRTPDGPPHAIVFATRPIPFAVREPLPGVDLDTASPRPGVGVALWFAVDDADGLRTAMEQAGVSIVTDLVAGPFGRTFSFTDPDGYVVTVHDNT